MADGRFLNREDELSVLERRWETGEGQIFTLWGRRRVGKTLLLARFCQGKRHLFFEAPSGSATDQLTDFSRRLAEATGRTPLAATDWRQALDALADWAEEGPLVAIFDEFQFLARQSPDIGSTFNIWWRERGQELPIFIVLSGSEVGFFEREVLGYSAITYGRRSGQLRLRPFRPEHLRLFLPDWEPEDRIRAYACFGGMPFYLDQIRPERNLERNILDLILMPDGLLREEARLLLLHELTESADYFSVLRAVAAGQTRVAEMSNRTGISAARVSQMLTVLQRLWLLERQVPVTETNPERSRKTFYRISDHYLKFWFRFVLPFESRLIDPAGAERHLDEYVASRLDEFVAAPAFEEVCQAWLLRNTSAAAVGWWWGKVRESRAAGLMDVDRELDAVAVDGDGEVIAVGSCKWTNAPMQASELERVRRLAAHLGPNGPPPAICLFARSGFSAELQEAAAATASLDPSDDEPAAIKPGSIRLISPADLV